MQPALGSESTRVPSRAMPRGGGRGTRRRAQRSHSRRRARARWRGRFGWPRSAISARARRARGPRPRGRRSRSRRRAPATRPRTAAAPAAQISGGVAARPAAARRRRRAARRASGRRAAVAGALAGEAGERRARVVVDLAVGDVADPVAGGDQAPDEVDVLAEAERLVEAAEVEQRWRRPTSAAAGGRRPAGQGRPGRERAEVERRVRGARSGRAPSARARCGPAAPTSARPRVGGRAAPRARAPARRDAVGVDEGDQLGAGRRAGRCCARRRTRRARVRDDVAPGRRGALAGAVAPSGRRRRSPRRGSRSVATSSPSRLAAVRTGIDGGHRRAPARRRRRRAGGSARRARAARRAPPRRRRRLAAPRQEPRERRRRPARSAAPPRRHAADQEHLAAVAPAHRGVEHEARRPGSSAAASATNPSASSAKALSRHSSRSSLGVRDPAVEGGHRRPERGVASACGPRSSGRAPSRRAANSATSSATSA